MHSKTIMVTSQVPNTITNVSIRIASRLGDTPKTQEADGWIHPDWGDEHAVELDKPTTISYGDDQNPYIDAVLVNFTPSGGRPTQSHFGVNGVRGSAEDNALNMHDTFLITLVKSDSDPVNVTAVMECNNSNGSGSTVTFPR